MPPPAFATDRNIPMIYRVQPGSGGDLLTQAAASLALPGISRRRGTRLLRAGEFADSALYGSRAAAPINCRDLRARHIRLPIYPTNYSMFWPRRKTPSPRAKNSSDARNATGFCATWSATQSAGNSKQSYFAMAPAPNSTPTRCAAHSWSPQPGQPDTRPGADCAHRTRARLAHDGLPGARHHKFIRRRPLNSPAPFDARPATCRLSDLFAVRNCPAPGASDRWTQH